MPDLAQHGIPPGTITLAKRSNGSMRGTIAKTEGHGYPQKRNGNTQHAARTACGIPGGTHSRATIWCTAAIQTDTQRLLEADKVVCRGSERSIWLAMCGSGSAASIDHTLMMPAMAVRMPVTKLASGYGVVAHTPVMRNSLTPPLVEMAIHRGNTITASAAPATGRRLIPPLEVCSQMAR
jgi:hypothetical protein